MHAADERNATALPPSLRALDRTLVLAVGLVVATLAVYFRVCQFGFVQMDDPIYVSGNQHVLSGLTFSNVKWSFMGFHDANWIPLTWLSLMLDAQIFGPRPGGFHLTNVLLHVVNALLVFAVLARATGNQTRSAFVAALFALHPLHIESVAWIAERKDVLSILFGLLSLLAYVDYAKRPRRVTWTASFVFFVCSLMSKQTLVTLPFVFLLLDYWPLRRFGAGDRREGTAHGHRVIEKLPFFAASAAFSVIAIFAQHQAIGPLKLFPLSTRCLNALVVYVAYLRQALVPYDLAAFYPYPETALAPAAAGAAALLLAVSLASVLWVRKLPFLFVGWSWYLGTLVPMIGIVQIGAQQMADRYTYFPLIGVFLAVAWLVPELVPAGLFRTRLLGAAAMVSLALLAMTSFVQVGYWRDSITLYRRGLEVAPDNPYLVSSLGYAMLSQGDADEGLRLLEAASRVPPPSSKRHFALALGLQKLGRLNEAAAEYQATLALDNSDAEAHSNLAVILSASHRYDEAKRHLLRAIEIDPDYVNSYVNLGVVCMALSQYDDAIDYSQQALALDPLMMGCHHTIALALRAQGRLDEAIRQYRYLVQAAPDDVQARLELRRTLAMKGQSSEP